MTLPWGYSRSTLQYRKYITILRSIAYDTVFRKRVIEYKGAGYTFEEVYEAFKVDSKRYYSWKRLVLLKANSKKNVVEK
jgi:hypothetical protein